MGNSTGLILEARDSFFTQDLTLGLRPDFYLIEGYGLVALQDAGSNQPGLKNTVRVMIYQS